MTQTLKLVLVTAVLVIAALWAMDASLAWLHRAADRWHDGSAAPSFGRPWQPGGATWVFDDLA